MPDRLPPPPPKFSLARLSKTVAFWMILILVTVVFFQLTARKGGDAPEISYSDFQAALDRGNVGKVEIVALQDLRGEFKSPEQIDNKPVLRFTVQLPFQASEAFTK